MRYEWEPKIWDPMAASASIKPTFSSPEGTLPAWLKWEDGVRLAGVPDTVQPPIHVTAIAKVSFEKSTCGGFFGGPRGAEVFFFSHASTPRDFLLTRPSLSTALARTRRSRRALSFR